jgi:hypothetical protein
MGSWVWQLQRTDDRRKVRHSLHALAAAAAAVESLDQMVLSSDMMTGLLQEIEGMMAIVARGDAMSVQDLEKIFGGEMRPDDDDLCPLQLQPDEHSFLPKW